MRFDDKLATVLAQPREDAAARAAAWRQIVDILAQLPPNTREPLTGRALATVRDLRDAVPHAVRAGAVAAIAGRRVHPAVVALLAEEKPAIAAALIGRVRLADDEWLDLLPRLSPVARSLLRHRRDLAPAVLAGLASFGRTDFALPPASAAEAGRADAPPIARPAEAAQAGRPGSGHDGFVLAAEEVAGARDAAPERRADPAAIAPPAEIVPACLPDFGRDGSVPPTDEGADTAVDPSSALQADPSVIACPAGILPTGPSDREGFAPAHPGGVAAMNSPLADPAEDAAIAEPAGAAPVAAAGKGTPAAMEDADPAEATAGKGATRVDRPGPLAAAPVAGNAITAPESVDDQPVRSAGADDGVAAAGPDMIAQAPAALPAGAAADHMPAALPAEAGIIRLPLSAPASEQAEPELAVGETRIRDLLARIAAFRREDAPAGQPAAPDAFRFETGPDGVVRWIDAAPRGPVIGTTIARAATSHDHGVDGQAAGAFRHRAPFRDARLMVAGQSAMAGTWRIAGVPLFDPADGRFLGYRGAARRPRADERAGPSGDAGLHGSAIPADSLRQLVHELRTPLNAIVGFGEMIERQVLGPAAFPYRAKAADIVEQGRRLLGAVDDLDLAARVESKRLDQSVEAVDPVALLDRLRAGHEAAAAARGVAVAVAIGDAPGAVSGDPATIERMIGRLLAATIGLGQPGEAIGVALAREGDAVLLRIGRPAVLAGRDEAALLDPGYTPEGDWPDAPLLGLGFALRLVRNLAAAAGGALEVDATDFTLRLPAASRAGDASRSGAAPA